MGPGNNVLLIITGGIAAYKCLDLIRRLRDRGVVVRTILTEAASHFVTPLSVAALSEQEVSGDLFSPSDEARMSHIRRAREADLVVVAPATANILAKMATGIADDLASTTLLATDRPILVAPAMNTVMWRAAATRANMATLERRGVQVVGPAAGDLACGETGEGRMTEPGELVSAIEEILTPTGRLRGRHVLITSGPTLEPIDPVRYIANRSSGKQGHAIAEAAVALGADTTLVSGPTRIDDPAGARVLHVETAREMLAACRDALPADAVVCAAAVADWRVVGGHAEKISKADGSLPTIELEENPDILATIAAATEDRPRLVVGFAAETSDVVERATAKRLRKGCDWIVANDVSPGAGVLGGDDNTVHVITKDGVENWPRMSKAAVARRLMEEVARSLENHPGD
jgi:phosphopantothenoylcysteine decarboxylase/phosphopantothenate--cysteine ligase